MILRKPYALFIKYFKLLHVVMALFITILLYSSLRIYNCFRVYSIDYRSIADVLSTDNYVNFFSYFCIIVVLALTVILLVVMFYKDKPKNLYIYNFILYILLFVLYGFCGNALENTKSVILDIKLSKALRDFSLIACAFQALSLIFIVVRATGFDIKRFDFNTDLQELNISSADSEEIEVALEFDQNKIRTNIRNKMRHLKYFYFEHKYIINISLLVFTFIVIGFSYYRFRLFNINKTVGKSFDVENYSFNVVDSYLVEKDFSGSNITSDDGVIVAVRMQIRGFGNKLVLNKGAVNLSINGLTYGVNVDQAKLLPDLGLAYTRQRITTDYTTYLFAFEVAKSQAKRNIKLKINDYNSYIGGKIGSRNYYIKLKPIDLRKNNDLSVSKKVGESINFSDSVIGSTSFLINKYEINNMFKLGYKYCYSKNKCLDSYEYISATATGNYFKTLMRIDGSMSIDRTKNINNYHDFVSFLNSYGTINYKIDNIIKSKKIDSSILKPSSARTSDIFVEVPYEVKDADEVYFTFKIRNQNYKYLLK